MFIGYPPHPPSREEVGLTLSILLTQRIKCAFDVFNFSSIGIMNDGNDVETSTVFPSLRRD